jgi:hypothetical protein
MKTLLIEQTRIGNSGGNEVIMLHDLFSKTSSYIYMNELDYREWVIEQANAYRKNGYKIFNESNITLNNGNN